MFPKKYQKLLVQFGWSDKNSVQTVEVQASQIHTTEYEKAKGLKIIPSMMIHDVHTENSSNVIIWRSPGRSETWWFDSKIQTFSPNSSKESLKWYKVSIQDDSWCSHPFFQNSSIEALNFVSAEKTVPRKVLDGHNEHVNNYLLTDPKRLKNGLK